MLAYAPAEHAYLATAIKGDLSSLRWFKHSDVDNFSLDNYPPAQRKHKHICQVSENYIGLFFFIFFIFVKKFSEMKV